MSIGIIIGLVVALAGIGTAFYFAKKAKDIEQQGHQLSEEKIKNAAQQLVKDKLAKAEQEANELRSSAKRMHDRIKSQNEEQEKQVSRKLSQLNSERQELDKREKKLISREKKVDSLFDEVTKKRDELLENIKNVADLTKDEAREMVKKEVEEDIVNFKAKKIREAEESAKEKIDDNTKQILIEAMQSVSIDYVDETTISSVKLPSEDVKGRIIGKDGRNVRAFEKETGVDVIIDDAPQTIGLSSFDPVRREIAKQSLENLIKDGRIHPGTIEYHVKKAKQNMVQKLKKDGKAIANEAGWFDVPEDLFIMLGRFKYRYSHGQSLYHHTLEVMHVAEYIAQELNADVTLVKKAALLHDIGKVLTHKIKKKHHHISGEIARKHQLDKKLVNAIEAHHGDIEPESVEAVIIQIADAISGARPGARKENYSDYVERLESLEKKVYEVVGDRAEEIYALRAGREVRVMVKPDQIDDNQAVVLARDIAKKIEESGVFPGSVQVVVVRELRATAETT